ncbi:hypothetical protein [Metabacillus sp. SLBN-84]
MNQLQKILLEERDEIIEWFQEQEDENMLGSTISVRSFQWKTHTVSFEGDFRHRINGESPIYPTLDEALDEIIVRVLMQYNQTP